MTFGPKRRGMLGIRLIVGLALVGCPSAGSAAGTWSVISLPQRPGEVTHPIALAVDAAGNLYVAGLAGIQERDTQGNWSLIATGGDAIGQVASPTAVAVDVAGNLYVLDFPSVYGRIQKRDAQGNWSEIVSQAWNPTALAVDTAGNLYVTDRFGGGPPFYGDGQISKRDAQGNWSPLATPGPALGQVSNPSGLAVDGTGNLYVADTGNHRVLKYTSTPAP